MGQHDRFARFGHVRRTSRTRWPRADRRRLAAIERALAADAPALSAKFAVFSRLTDGQQPAGAEFVPPPAWPRPRPRHLAALLTLAAVTAVCVTLSVQLPPASQACPVAAAATAAAATSATPGAAAAAAVPHASGSAPASGYSSFHASFRSAGCSAYPATRQ